MEFIPDILNILSTVGIVNGLRLPAVAIIASSAGRSHLRPSGLALRFSERRHRFVFIRTVNCYRTERANSIG